MTVDEEFLAPRRCMREPIPEIFVAARMLDQAVEAHLAGDLRSAARLIKSANLPAIRAWTESLWGSKKANPNQAQYHRYRHIHDAPPHLPRSARVAVRMPNTSERRAIIDRYGRNCMFCGIPLIRKEVRDAIQRAYSAELEWGNTNESQHAAFQCMWLQFDHVTPHCRGGDNSIDNVVVTCAPCNYGRWHWILEEVGLKDPRLLPIHKTMWDGLERFLAHQ